MTIIVRKTKIKKEAITEFGEFWSIHNAFEIDIENNITSVYFSYSFSGKISSNSLQKVDL